MSPSDRRRYVRLRPVSPTEVVKDAREDGGGDGERIDFWGRPVSRRRRSEEADAILRRAFEGGFFERWRGEVWRRSARDEVRAAARELLGPLAASVVVRLEFRGKDAFKDLPALPTGDWTEVRDMRLHAVVAWEEGP